jgi:Raf kinase inhibitor-like YbhB/YbcL family protein
VSSTADARPRDDGGVTDATEPSDAGLATDASPVDAAPGPDAAERDAGTPPDAEPPADAEPAPDASAPAPMTLDSPDLPAGAEFPPLHTCAGRDLQPQLDLANVPAGAQSLAIVLIDDTIDFVHWVALDLPPTTTTLAQGASDARMLPMGTREIPAYGTQYRGPCPPSTHTYTFRLYALPSAMTTYRWRRTINGAQVDAAFAGHLAQARLTRTYTP